MSHGNNQVVRQRVTVKPHARRRVDERVAIRFPALAALVLKGFSRMPPESKARRVLLKHFARRAIEAINRGDIEAAVITLSVGCESFPPPEFVALGFEPMYRGRQERVDFQREWIAVLEEWQQEIEELIDCGNRIVVLARMSGTGLMSATPFERLGAYVLTIEAGAIVREHMFTTHREALAAVGLAE